MDKYTADRPYSRGEELFNVISHGLGFLLSLAAMVILIVFASLDGDVWHIVSFSIYGASLVLLYLASTLYHSSKRPRLRHKLNVFDHSSIYVLIAGTYTPFLLVTLRGPWGWSMLAAIWVFAIAGIVVKIFFTGKYDMISAIAYVVMGWLIVIAFKPLVDNLPAAGLWWLTAGGISYTIGAVFYLLTKLPYHHGVFHILVLLGSICHFVAVFWYVLG